MICFSRLKSGGCIWGIPLFLISTLTLLFWSFPTALSAQESSCVSCHTSAEKLIETIRAIETSKAEIKEKGQKGDVAPPGSYEKWLVDAGFSDEDAHGEISCEECHGGNPEDNNWKTAHMGLTKDPSYPDPSQCCGECHEEIVEGDETSLHINLAHFKEETNISCGQCHVSRPVSVGGGLIEGHMFLKKPSDMHNWFRHGWLPQEGLHLTGVDCQKCHNLLLESAIRDCGQCHSEKSILLTKVDTASGYSLKNWRFTNKELMTKGGLVVGSNRIPALDVVGILIIILTFAGCFIHGGLRFITRRRR